MNIVTLLISVSLNIFLFVYFYKRIFYKRITDLTNRINELTLQTKKYKLINYKPSEIDGIKIYRIKALRSFYCNGELVEIGDLGGYINDEKFLSHTDNSWIDWNTVFIGYDKKYDSKKSYTSNESFIEPRYSGDRLIDYKYRVNVIDCISDYNEEVAKSLKTYKEKIVKKAKIDLKKDSKKKGKVKKIVKSKVK